MRFNGVCEVQRGSMVFFWIKWVLWVQCGSLRFKVVRRSSLGFFEVLLGSVRFNEV